jgi:hypothetical protein
MNMMTKISKASPDGAPTARNRRVASASMQFMLPALPEDISPELARIAADYAAGFKSGSAALKWGAAAQRALEFQPKTRREWGAKLLIGLHFQSPELCDGRLAVEAPEAAHDRLATEIVLDCLDWALSPPNAGTDRRVWRAALSAYRHAAAAHEEACSITDQALERYYAERPDNGSHPEIQERTGVTAAEAAAEAVCTADDEAFKTLLATPAPDLAAVVTKLELLRDVGVDYRDVPLLIDDLRRLSGESEHDAATPSAEQDLPDAALVAAYEEYRSLLAVSYSLHPEDERGADVISGRMEAPDAVLFGSMPKTIEGVNALLRRTLPMVENVRWLERAIAYGDNETLEERKDELPDSTEKLVECVLALTNVIKARTTGESLAYKLLDDVRRLRATDDRDLIASSS